MLKVTNKRKFILNENMSKVILTLAAPIMLNNAIQSVYNLTDTYFVSQLGATQMAAMTLVWPVIFFFLALGMGINIAGNSLISQHIGDNNQKEATRVAGEVLSTALISSLIIGIIGYFAAPYVIQLMGGSGELLEDATGYLRIMLAGMPTLFAFFAFTGIKQGQGDMVTPMKFTAMSVFMNIVLDPIFIFTLGLGVPGAAYATVLSRGLFTSYAIYTLFFHGKGIQLKAKDLVLSSKVKTLIQVGLPSSIGQSTAAFGFIFLNIFIISFGENTLAAFGIGNRINSMILMPGMGIGKALTTVIGQNLGADQIKRARQAVKTSVILATTILLGGGLIFFQFIPTVVGFFTSNAEVHGQATYFLQLITLSLPLMGFFQIFVGTFQGSGHTVYAMILMMGRLWALRLPMIVLFREYTLWGSSGVWYAMVLSNLITCIVGSIIYFHRKWERKVIKSTPAEKRLAHG